MTIYYRSPALAQRIRFLRDQTTPPLTSDANEHDRCYEFFATTPDHEMVERLSITDTLNLNLQTESVYTLPHDTETHEIPSDSDAIRVPEGSRSKGMDGSRRPLTEVVNQSSRGDIAS